MAAANSSLNFLPLDFLTYKNSLISFMKAQSIFKGYNFEAPTFNVFFDLLTYNSFFNGFYGNMVGSEMFFDSCQLKDSAASHAKDLNYTPRSNKSAVGDVTIVINTGNSAQTSAFITKYSSFSGRIGSNSYTFSTNSNIVAVSPNSTITISNTQIYEGPVTTDTYMVDYSNTAQRFIISNPDVDTSGLFVLVSEDGGASNLEYQLAPSLFGLTANSKVYFIQGAEGNTYELIFGDNIIGRRPVDNSIVYATYRISSGSAPNLIANVTPNGTLGGFSNISVTLLSPVHDGAFAESIDSIKFNAPRAFNAQERAVIDEDYETLLQINFPEIIAISAYGGDELNPPQYGKVFISVLINGVDGIPAGKITDYTNWINDKLTVTLVPVFINPTFLFVDVNTTIKYNINVTQVDPETISSEVANTILTFNTQNLNDFKTNLYYSQFVTAISNSDPSIISNETTLRLMSKITPVGGKLQNFSFSFNQPLVSNLPPLASNYTATEQTVITSSLFLSQGKTCLIEDDGIGNLRLVQTSGTQHKTISNIGTVDYSTGDISINNLMPDTGFLIKLYAKAESQDLVSATNVILQIEPSDIVINVEQVRV